MRVIVETSDIKNKVKDLLMSTYGIKEDEAEDISFDVRRILIENEDD